MKNWRITRVLMSMADTFLARRVTRSAAELAYYMVMALFPAIICMYDLLALILRDPTAVLRIVETLVLPRETQTLVSEFLTYVSGNTSEVMFFAALLVMITSASAAFRAMAAIVGEIHGAKRFGIVRSTIVSVIFSVAFLLVLYLCILLMLTGNVAQDVATIAKSQAGRTCSDFGYSGVDYGAWCDEYVADCLENAGCDDSIVAHGGTVADFEKKMRKRGAVVVSSPQPGDLLFFSWSHVEIVTRVEGGTVYCAGGNNQGKTYPGGRCAGERNAQSVAKSMGGSIRLYLRPNYPNPDPPKPAPTLTVSTGNSSIETTFSWNTVEGATEYDVKIWKGKVWEGDPYLVEWGASNPYSVVLPEGTYQAYVDTRFGSDMQMSNIVTFNVTKAKIQIGDLNSDNTLTTADAVLLQRYLLQERTLTQSQWQTADLNADGTVNGFDLALLRQKLVG